MPTSILPKQNKENRRFYMYLYGLDQYEVDKFLKKSRASLIKAGAKVGTIPKEHTHRASFLSKLPIKCDQIIANWFNENPVEGEIGELNDAFERLSKLKENFIHSSESGKKLWRTVFVNFINKDYAVAVKLFLKGESTLKKIEPKVVNPEIKMEQNIIEKEKHKNFLNEIEVVVPQNITQKNNSYGFKYIDVKKLDIDSMNIGEENLVLGEIKTINQGGSFFIEIRGAIIDSSLVTLSEAEAINFFPVRGSAIGFVDKLPRVQLARNSFGLWKVRDQKNNKSARFIIDSHFSTIFDVIEIPHSSLEPDLVREWLRNVYLSREGIYHVFQLKDGIILKANNIYTDYKIYDFSVPFFAYYSHEAVNWNGRRIVIKEFPTPSFKYECITTEVAVKRLFKFRSEVSNFPTITHHQIQELAFLVGKEYEDKSYSNVYQSITERISSIFTIKENIDLCINEITNLPEVQSKIEEEITTLKNQVSKDLLVENEKINALKKEKKSLENEIKENSNIVNQEIKKAFDNAVKNGMNTLTQVAVLKPFLSNFLPIPVTLSGASSEKSLGFIKSNEITTFQNLRSFIEINSIRYALESDLLSVVISLGLTRGVIGVFGNYYKKLINILSKITSNGFYLSISLSVDKFSLNDLLNLPVQESYSISSGLLFGNILELWQEQDFPLIVELKGFNRIPPESIIEELLDNGNFLKDKRKFIWQTSTGDIKKITLKAPVFFVLNFSYGNSTFPIPKAYAPNIPLVACELFNCDALEEDIDIPVNTSYLGHDFFNNRIDYIEDVNIIELLKLFGLKESEAICYTNLVYKIGRLSQNELINILDVDNFLNFVNLNALLPEYEQYIFQVTGT